MTHLKHPNLIPCVASERVSLRAGNQGAISEYFIVMPYYRVSCRDKPVIHCTRGGQ